MKEVLWYEIKKQRLNVFLRETFKLLNAKNGGIIIQEYLRPRRPEPLKWVPTVIDFDLRFDQN